LAQEEVKQYIFREEIFFRRARFCLVERPFFYGLRCLLAGLPGFGALEAVPHAARRHLALPWVL